MKHKHRLKPGSGIGEVLSDGRGSYIYIDRGLQTMQEQQSYSVYNYFIHFEMSLFLRTHVLLFDGHTT